MTLKSLVCAPERSVWDQQLPELNSVLRRARVLRALRRDPARNVLDAAEEGPPPVPHGMTRYNYFVHFPSPANLAAPPGPADDPYRYRRWNGEVLEATVGGMLLVTVYWRRLGATAVARAGLDVARKAVGRGEVTDRHPNGGRRLTVSLCETGWLTVLVSATVLMRGSLPHWDILHGQTAYGDRNVDGIVRCRLNPDLVCAWDYTLNGDPTATVDYQAKQSKCFGRMLELRALRQAGALPDALAKCTGGFLVSHIVGCTVYHEHLPYIF